MANLQTIHVKLFGEYFFLIPFIYTIWFSLGFIESGGSVGLKVSFVGIKNYIYVFTEATATPRGESELTFLEFLTQSIISILTDIPIILIFSLIMAVVLNSKFKGRAFVRAVFFVPVIFNSQAIDVATKAYTVLDESTSGATKDLFEQMFSFKDFLTNANFPKWLVDFLGNASQKIYDIIAYSGIQILIFLSAIQSVPRHLYEAAKMEGATQYEMFWKITFPMVSPMLLAAAVYTVVDSFLRSPMITILDKFSKPGTQEVTSEDLGLLIDGKNVLSNYGIGASISLIFTVVIGILLAIVLGVLSKVVFYYDE